MNSNSLSRHNFVSLVEIVSCLRGPDGCPWDKEQTHESLTRYAIEETFELVEVLESKPQSPRRDQNMKEELGDVLFQVLLHAQIASERGAFTIEDVITTLSEKMIRRHPHVFGGEKVKSAEEVVQNWAQIKAQEKGASSPAKLDVPPLPALQRAYKIGKKTEGLKFDWEDANGALLKVEEEFAELKEALDEDQESAIFHELGDTLFSLAQLGRHLKMEPEQVLRSANRRFEERFELMVSLLETDGLAWNSLDMTVKDAYWVKAKNIIKARTANMNSPLTPEENE